MKNSGLMIGRKRRAAEEVTWQAPEEGWFKMNVEGVSRTQLAACGGLLRNHQGTFLQGFTMKTGELEPDHGPSTSSSTNNNINNTPQAQLWGCLFGLKIAWDFGVRKLLVETTYSAAAQVGMQQPPENLEGRSNRRWPVSGDLLMLEMEIQQMLERRWEVRFLVVKRESNVAAYNLAEAALSCMPGFHVLHSLPHHVHQVVLQEAPPPGNKKIK